MVDLDLKDRKILYQLDLNCRQSNTQIGKKVGLSRKVVEYRIKRMEDEGIIKAYWADVNSFKLGYNVFRIYIAYQNASSDIKNKIIQHFSNYDNLWVLYSIQGPIDLGVIVWAKDIYKFYNFWNKTLELYEDYFSQATISLYIQLQEFHKVFLLDKYNNENKELYKFTCNDQFVKIDEMDYNLSKELAINGRIPLIDLADKFNCSSQKIKYRINNLKKLKVIQAFRISIDVSKLGLQRYKLDIYLKEHKQRNNIIEYLSRKPYLDTINVAFGWADIEPELVVENVNSLLEIIEDLDKKFPGAIKKQTYWLDIGEHKMNAVPKMEFK